MPGLIEIKNLFQCFNFIAINTTGFDKLLLGSERITDVLQPSPPTANLANRVSTVKSLCVYNYLIHVIAGMVWSTLQKLIRDGHNLMEMLVISHPLLTSQKVS